MGRNRIRALHCLFGLALAFAAAGSGLAAQPQDSLVGTSVLNFSLPSTENRLINYGSEYYGKHHLIITFFPAAFTPV